MEERNGCRARDRREREKNSNVFVRAYSSFDLSHHNQCVVCIFAMAHSLFVI